MRCKFNDLRAKKSAAVDPAVVPKLWPASTFVCFAGGPSLTPEDVDACQGKVHAIAVNDSYRLAPWAVAIMASDFKWWKHHDGAPGFLGRRYCLQPEAADYGAEILRNTGKEGIETDPGALRSGMNSGAAAINLAIHFGAMRILLLGYDMGHPGRPSHWFGEHPKELRARSPYHSFGEMFKTQVKPLRNLGVQVWNCSRTTALTCFPLLPLEVALRDA